MQALYAWILTMVVTIGCFITSIQINANLKKTTKLNSKTIKKYCHLKFINHVIATCIFLTLLIGLITLLFQPTFSIFTDIVVWIGICLSLGISCRYSKYRI